ncbi:MAG: DUF89 family protein [Negativicutes bacterium]|nr:DUF89 family protein [Negativicutes bacterium]
MKILLDCLPCMLRQVLEAACMSTSDEAVQANIMDDAIKKLENYRSYECSPKLCEDMHLIVKRHSGVEDPYASIKSRDIDAALKLEPLIRSLALNEGNLLLKALKVSAIGNVMDSAIYKDLKIESCFEGEFAKSFAICDIDAFEKTLAKAKNILIIGDNAGEVVFDKFLVELLSAECILNYAVREAPIINDATFEDAVKAGMHNYATVFSTGCGAPGAVLDSCSEAFQNIFDSADIIISKGQGNFEALSDTKREIYFLLKAKCQRIATALGVEVNEYIFKKKIFD